MSNTLYFVARSNKSSGEKHFAVKIRTLFEKTEFNSCHTPENQYNELKHRVLKLNLSNLLENV